MNVRGKWSIPRFAWSLMLLAVIRPDVGFGQVPKVEAPDPAVPRDEAIDAAWKLVRAGKGEAALQTIREASKSHPDWPPPWVILAKMLISIGQLERGHLALEEASTEAPDHPVVALTFAAVDMAEGRRHDAKLNADRVLALVDKKGDPSGAQTIRHEALKILAAIAESRREWEVARGHLLAMLEIRPRNGADRQALGRVLFRMNRPEEAYTELKTAARDAPDLEPAEVSMALLTSQLGDVEKAAQWFERAKVMQPRAARPRVAHALWLLDQGRLDAAQAVAAEAKRLEPNAEEPKKLQGLVAFHRRDLPAAEGVYEDLHKVSPDAAGIANLLALTLVDQDDKAKRLRGLQLAEGLARKFPRSPDILGTLGRAHDRNGHPQDAEINLRAAVSGGKASADTTYFLASLLADRGRNDEARALLLAVEKGRGAFAYRKEASELLAKLPPPAR